MTDERKRRLKIVRYGSMTLGWLDLAIAVQLSHGAFRGDTGDAILTIISLALVCAWVTVYTIATEKLAQEKEDI